VAVNGAGKLTLFNPVARAIAGGGREADLGKAASEVIPELGLEETLKSGGEETGKLLQLGRSTVMASKIPIRVGGDIVGAVATLHDVTSIQDMEQRIRKEIYQKGHVAKFTFADIVAQDPAMLRTLAYARQFARTSASVVIKGETGVGKELLARASTTPAIVRMAPSWRSTARPCRRISWRASSSGTWTAPSPGRARRASRASSSWPTGAPSSWTRSRKFP
jgi:transcriptional regulator with PAS, ATPase and Fis domain